MSFINEIKTILRLDDKDWKKALSSISEAEKSYVKESKKNTEALINTKQTLSLLEQKKAKELEEINKQIARAEENKTKAIENGDKALITSVNKRLTLYKQQKREIESNSKIEIDQSKQSIKQIQETIATQDKYNKLLKTSQSTFEEYGRIVKQSYEEQRQSIAEYNKAIDSKLSAEEKDRVSIREKAILFTSLEKTINSYNSKIEDLGTALRKRVITNEEYAKSLKLINEELAKSTGVKSFSTQNKALSSTEIASGIDNTKSIEEEKKYQKAKYDTVISLLAQKRAEEELTIAKAKEYEKQSYVVKTSLLAQKRAEEANIETLKESYQRTYVNTNAQNQYADAVKNLTHMKNMGAITNEQYTLGLANAKKSIDENNTSLNNLANTTIRYLRWAGTIAGVFYAAQRAWDLTLGKGIEVNKMIEDNTTGIAALLGANTSMILSNGKVVNSYEKFQMGLLKSKEIMDNIRVAAKSTYATFPQLTEIYQQAIGQTLSFGTSFGKTVDDISNNTIKLAQRMSNIGGAIGQPMDRIKEEIRSMVSGNVSTDSIISTMIFGSPTQANEAIKKAKEAGTNGLKDMLDSYLKAFDVLEGVKTYTKAQLDLQDAISQTQGQLAEPTFNALKEVFNDLAVQINKMKDDKTFAKWGESIVSTVKTIVEYADDVLIAFLGWKILPLTISAVRVAITALSEASIVAGSSIANFSKDATLATAKTEALALAGTRVGIALKGLAVSLAPLAAVMIAYEGYNWLIGDNIKKEETLKGIMSNKIDDLNKVSTAQLQYNKLLLQESVINKEKQSQEAKQKAKEYSESFKAGGSLAEDIQMSKSQEIYQAKLNAEAVASEEAIASTKEQLKNTESILITRENILKKSEEINKSQKDLGDLTVKLTRDSKIEEDSKTFIKKEEEEIVKLAKQKKSWSDELVKSEKALGELRAKYSGNNTIKFEDIDEVKKQQEYIKNLKEGILQTDKAIADEQAKKSKIATSEQNQAIKQAIEKNKNYAEEKAVLYEINALLNSTYDTETYKTEQAKIRVEKAIEEWKYLDAGIEKTKAYLTILQAQREYEKQIITEKEAQQKLLEKQNSFIKIKPWITTDSLDQQGLNDLVAGLRITYKDDEEALRDIDNAMDKWQKKLDDNALTLKINFQGFDEISNGLATVGNSFQSLSEAQAKYEKDLQDNKITKGSIKAKQAVLDYQDATISSYANMAGAVASFYDEDDERRKKQLEVQKALQAAKLVMDMANLASSTAFTSLFVAQEAVKAQAAGATAVAVAAQSSPWTGFATAAAMAAMLASFGIMLGGNTKTSTTSDAFSSQKANDGSGSALGDTSKQSESITKALETLQDFAKPQYKTLLSMNNYLANISNAIGGVTSLLIQGEATALGTNYTGAYNTGYKNNISISSGMQTASGLGLSAASGAFGATSGLGLSAANALGLTGGVATLGTSVLASTGVGIAIALVDKLLLKDAISGTIGKLANSVLGGVFGKTSVSQKLTDSGINFGDTLLSAAIEEFNGQAYQTISTTVKKKSWFGSSSKTSVKSYFEDLNDETERQFSLVLSNLYDTALVSGEALDASSEVIKNTLDNFKVSIGKISLKDKTGTEIQETLTAVFGKIGDDIAKATFPLLTPFQKVGEGLYTTMTRVATGMEEAEYYINRLGKSFTDLSYTEILNPQGDVGFEALLQSIVKTDEATYGLNNNLVQIIGSLDSTAEELYNTYTALDTLRDTLKFLKLDTDAISFASIRGAGSAEALATGMSAYIENFLTEEEQTAYQTALLQKEFLKLNVVMPSSKTAFTSLIQSLDLSSESGQELYGRLIILSESFATVSDSVETSITALQDSLKTLVDDGFTKFTDSLKSLFDLANELAASTQTTIQNIKYSGTTDNTEQLIRFNKLLKDFEVSKATTNTEQTKSIYNEILSLSGTIGGDSQYKQDILGKLNTQLAGFNIDKDIMRVSIVDGLGTLLGLNQQQVDNLKVATSDGKITNEELSSLGTLNTIQLAELLKVNNNGIKVTDSQILDLKTLTSEQKAELIKANVDGKITSEELSNIKNLTNSSMLELISVDNNLSNGIRVTDSQILDLKTLTSEQKAELIKANVDGLITNSELKAINSLTATQKDGILELSNNSNYFSTEATLSNLEEYSKLQLDAYRSSIAQETVGLSSSTLTYSDYVGKQEQIDIAKALGISFESAKPLIEQIQALSVSKNLQSDVNSLLGYAGTSYNVNAASQLESLSPYLSEDVKQAISNTKNTASANLTAQQEAERLAKEKQALFKKNKADFINIYNASQTTFEKEKSESKVAWDSLYYHINKNSRSGLSQDDVSSPNIATHNSIDLNSSYYNAGNRMSNYKKEHAEAYSAYQNLVALDKEKALKGYSVGGYTGDGSKYDVAGLVHKGEYVINQENVKSLGGQESIRQIVGGSLQKSLEFLSVVNAKTLEKLDIISQNFINMVQMMQDQQNTQNASYATLEKIRKNTSI